MVKGDVSLFKVFKNILDDTCECMQHKSFFHSPWLDTRVFQESFGQPYLSVCGRSSCSCSQWSLLFILNDWTAKFLRNVWAFRLCPYLSVYGGSSCACCPWSLIKSSSLIVDDLQGIFSQQHSTHPIIYYFYCVNKCLVKLLN